MEPDLVRRQSPVDRVCSWLIRGERPSASHLLLAPATLWLAAFLVLPVVSLLSLGFTHRGPYGAFEWVFTWANFRRALDLKYLPILIRTVCYSGASTLLCLLLGYPLAYFLSFQAGKIRIRIRGQTIVWFVFHHRS